MKILNREEKPIKLIIILKKLIGFGFISLKPKKPNRIKPKQKKTEPNRFEPVLSKNTKPNRFWFWFRYLKKKIILIIFFDKNQTKQKIITPTIFLTSNYFEYATRKNNNKTKRIYVIKK